MLLPVSMPPVSMFPRLTHLDVARNSLREMAPFALANLPSLTYLDVSYNDIARLGGLEATHQLQRLIAHHNRIRSITGLEHLRTLEDLDVADDQLTKEGGLRLLSLNAHLRRLDLRGNPIERAPR